MAATKSTAKSAAKAAAKVSTANPALAIQLQLRVIAVELRCALSTITVASQALCLQNADIDADVAVTLQRGASGSVHAALVRIEAMLRQMESTGGASIAPEEECVH